LKTPGKSLGETITDLIEEHKPMQFERDLDEIRKNGCYIPWVEAKKELGLNRSIS